MSDNSITVYNTRLLIGDFFEPRTTAKGKALANPTYLLSFALDKRDPACNNFEAFITEQSRRLWPNGEWQDNKFLTKTYDGDDRGEKFYEMEGAQGCLIFKCSSLRQPQLVDQNNVIITDSLKAKCGYYYNCNLSISTNDNQRARENSTPPGIHINLQLAKFAGFGPELFGGGTVPLPEEAFTDQQGGYVPAEMSQSPVDNYDDNRNDNRGGGRQDNYQDDNRNDNRGGGRQDNYQDDNRNDNRGGGRQDNNRSVQPANDFVENARTPQPRRPR